MKWQHGQQPVQTGTGVPNDGFLPNALKHYFRLFGVLLKIYKWILSCVIKFISVQSFQGSFRPHEFIRAFLVISRKPQLFLADFSFLKILADLYRYFTEVIATAASKLHIKSPICSEQTANQNINIASQCGVQKNIRFDCKYDEYIIILF